MAAGGGELGVNGAFHDHLGGQLDHLLLGKFSKREGDIALRPASLDGLVGQSLECFGEGLPASEILLHFRHALALGYL
jgi:hypothetical protein